MAETAAIGVIGGSGLYEMPEITDKTVHQVETPFGAPSADIVIGTLRGKRVAFLPRHGAGHSYSPSTVPYRANIYALKSLGVRFILSVNACGSLREDYAPGHIIIPDQIYDNTKSERGGRSFFTEGVVGHIGVADPFSTELAQVLYDATRRVEGAVVHKGGNLVVIEGPRFSTRGESNIYRQWGCSIIGMTNAPEAFLAREAEIAYAIMAHVTDYDVWHEEPVNVEMVIRTLNHNLQIAQAAVANAVEMLDAAAVWACHTALDYAFITARDAMPPEKLAQLKPIVGRALGMG